MNLCKDKMFLTIFLNCSKQPKSVNVFHTINLHQCIKNILVKGLNWTF